MEYQIYSVLGSFFYVVIFTLGLCLGSFLNSWIWRHHENIRISKGRSICPTCRRQLKWYENIPVFSFIFLGGRCRTCHKKIPSHFIWVELGIALLFVFITHYHLQNEVFSSTRFHRDFIFVGILAVIFIYDYLYKIILPEIMALGVAAGLYFNYFLDRYSLLNLLGAACLAGGFFLLQYIISKGRWIGGGDVRMGVMMGVWLGWPNILAALAAAYFLGALVSLLLLALKKKKMTSQVPFGTFLSLATLLVLFYGRNLIDWYLNLL